MKRSYFANVLSASIGVYLILFSCATALAGNYINEIRYPLLNNPAIILAGSDLNIHLSIADIKDIQRIELVSGDSVVALSDYIQTDKTADGLIVVTAEVPGEALEALYDLRAIFSDGHSDTQPHAVKVIHAYKKDFDFIHFTDIHFNSKRELGPDLNELRTNMLEAMSELNPEFAIFSGDLGLDPDTYNVDYDYGYEQFVAHFKTPMFMVPGNHEFYIDNRPEKPIDGRYFWEQTYGPTYLSFDYGKLHVVGINNFDWKPKYRDRWDQDLAFFGTQGLACVSPEQWKWLVDDLKQAKAREMNIIGFTHIPLDFLQGGKKIGFGSAEKIKGPDPDRFVKLMNSFGVSHLFIGHMHKNEIKEYGGMQQVMTLSAGSGDTSTGPWGFRIVHVRDYKVVGSEVREYDIGFNQ